MGAEYNLKKNDMATGHEKTGWNQLGPRWLKTQLPVDAEPHYMLIVIQWHMLNDTPTSVMTVLRPAIKGQKVGSGPVPRNLHPFPQITGIIFPLISLWNYPAHKN